MILVLPISPDYCCYSNLYSKMQKS